MGAGALPFYSLTNGQQIEGLTWLNTVDDVSPYETGYQDKKWVYIHENCTVNQNIIEYTKSVKRFSFCQCTDGCKNPKKCACYKQNRKLLNPTY